MTDHRLERLACLVVGRGRPLVYLPGIAPHHRPPTGLDRLFQVATIRPLARGRQVWWVQRPEGLPAGTTMAGIAADVAAALRERFDGPVDVVGSSTGGSVALQVAVDSPDVVRRLVLLSSACRLGPAGYDLQRRMAASVVTGRVRDAGALWLGVLGTRAATRRLLGALGRVLGPALVPSGPCDLTRTIAAEDAFDLTARLPEVQVPVLVVGGGRDRFYGEDLFRETAEGLPAGDLLLHPRRGHVGAQASPRTARAVLTFLAETDEERRAAADGDAVRVEGEVLVHRPVEDVFAVVGDPATEPLYNPAMLRVHKVTAGPVAVGSRYRNEARSALGSGVMDVEVTALEPPRRLATAARSAALDVDGEVVLEPVAAGTRLRWSWRVRPRGWARLLTPVLAVAGRRLERRTWEGLRRYVEQGAAAGAGQTAGGRDS